MTKFLALFCIAMAAAGSVSAGQDRDVISADGKVDIATATIGSRDQLEQHLATNPNSPIFGLSASERSHFVGSLVFTSHGLGSYAYTDLAGLSVTDAYKVLSLFGVQSTLSSIPNLRSETGLDDAILTRVRKNTTFSDGLAVPMVDPRYNSICTVSPNAPSRCVANYGSHCTDGCG